MTACTTTPASNLPPDPGVAGKQTLQGTDSDKDGVRDDLQRYIGLSSASANLKLELTSAAKNLQSALVATKTGDETGVNVALQNMRFQLDCSSDLSGSNEFRKLNDLVANTAERVYEYFHFNSKLGGVYPTITAAECNNKTVNGSRSSSRIPREIACIKPETGLVIMHINGIGTPYGDAKEELRVLNIALEDKIRQGNPGLRILPSELLYNSTSGIKILGLDIGDVSEAKNLLEKGYTTIDQFKTYLETGGKYGETTLRELLAVQPSAWGEFINFVTRIQEQVRRGNRVLLVGYSEGTIFSNLIIHFLNETASDIAKSVGILDIAAMVSVFKDSKTHVASYATLNNDSVVNLVTKFFPLTAPYNIINSDEFNNEYGLNNYINIPIIFSDAQNTVIFNGNIKTHRLDLAYLGYDSEHNTWKDNDSKALIQSKALDKISALTTPTPELGVGPFTATLSWGENPDVDLHVFEPTDTHVYYSNRTGDAGYLDLDDTDQYGPEHYYTDCNNVKEGTYTIGVNYYRGYSAENATVQINYGSQVESTSLTLPISKGTSGNSAPEIVVRVHVKKNPDGSIDISHEFNP